MTISSVTTESLHVRVDSYFEDLLKCKSKGLSSPLEECVEKIYPE